MRNGLKFIVAVMIAASAACGGDDDIELFQGEETATPSLDDAATQPEAEAALMTATFEAPEDAPEAGQQVSGTIRVFAADGHSDIGPTGEPTIPTTPDATATERTTDRAETDLSASATAGETGFRVEASLDGLSQGEHAWHIHSGPCGEDAPVVVAFSATEDLDGLAQPLNADQQGHAEGTATVPTDQLSLDRLQADEYSVHVHAQGGTDHGPTVACADLDGGFGR